ncbi:hypothetical protein K466DRAFT_666565 [Polyporus arcularius HHB13444]|uniref:F-box domain-containing protein n=1 Tax=Polyporus arcularius HHB13444 TaxID=1314778 RepID=A0A5C3NY09_9APHY|nr:hypothetical protein K466DRAFT_666565 [Polyporus arcularius HHB13444]
MSLLSEDAFVEDVVILIATQCLKMHRRSLISLASCSRQLRLVCMPLVFSTSSIKSIRFSSTPVPPPAIRPYIRRLIHVGMPDPLSFEELLEQLPELRTVVFNCAHGGVPLAVVEQCFRHARIASLSFADSSDSSAWAYTTTHLPGEESHPNSLKQLSYAANLSKITRTCCYQVDCRKEDIAEPGPIILRMHLSAESLSFPADRAPLSRMAELPWPCLRDLTLTGRYSDASQVSSIPQLVSALRNPRFLSIQVGQLADRPRPKVLERYCTELRALESLTLAYPDPHDAIFAVAGTSLRYLSIRDHPRHYLKNMPVNRRLAMPILSSSECLRVLSRMSMPRLEHLELVYEGDDLEEELLVHVAYAYSHLHTLELHQYRRSAHGPATLRYVSITLDLMS